jgi:hypothetical protein
MACGVCCGRVGGLAPNPAGCPCCGPQLEEGEEFFGDPGGWEDGGLCQVLPEEDWSDQMIEDEDGFFWWPRADPDLP